MIYPATDLARGWLSVAHASSKDKDRPALNRTLALEESGGGIRITATDSYMILTTWVPGVEHDTTEEPEPDEVPNQTAVAIDPDGRGAGFLTYALKIAEQYEKLDLKVPSVSVRLNVRNPSGQALDAPRLPGLTPLSVSLEMTDLERVDLATYEAGFPRWQGIMDRARFSGKPTTRIALHPERVAALAKVAKVHPRGHIGWTFCGDGEIARVEILESEPFVHGAVMPVRWDLWRDAPREDKPAEAPPDDGEVTYETADGTPATAAEILRSGSGTMTGDFGTAGVTVHREPAGGDAA